MRRYEASKAQSQAEQRGILYVAGLQELPVAHAHVPFEKADGKAVAGSYFGVSGEVSTCIIDFIQATAARMQVPPSFFTRGPKSTAADYEQVLAVHLFRCRGEAQSKLHIESAALLAADAVSSLEEGLVRARESLDSGAARGKLDALIEATAKVSPA